MARNKSKSAIALEYYGARALLLLLSLVPGRLRFWLGRRLGDLYRLVDRRHRLRAEENVKEILGLDGAAAKAFVRRNFRNYGMILAEFAMLARISGRELLERIDDDGLTRLLGKLTAEGRGVVLIGCHYGNWEWSSAAMGALGLEGGAIGRPLDNPRLNEHVKWCRERLGFKLFDKRGAIRRGLAALRKGQVLGLLFDQDAGPGGVMSPFLGKPASTMAIPVELAMRAGSPLVVAALRRLPGGDARFVVRYGPAPLRPDPGADPETETKRLVDGLNAELGRIILEEPDQWLWIHRRWKTRRCGERGGPAPKRSPART